MVMSTYPRIWLSVFDYFVGSGLKGLIYVFMHVYFHVCYVLSSFVCFVCILYVCVHIYLYVYLYVCIYMYVSRICIFACVYIYIYVYSSLLLSMYVLIHIFVCVKVIYLIVCLVDISVTTSRFGIAVWVVS